MFPSSTPYYTSAILENDIGFTLKVDPKGGVLFFAHNVAIESIFSDEVNSVSPSNTRPWAYRPNSFNPTSHPILCKNRFQATTLSLLEAKAGAKPIDSPVC